MKLSEKEIEECKVILREKARKERLAVRCASMDRRQRELSNRINTRYSEPVQQGPVPGANVYVAMLREKVWM